MIYLEPPRSASIYDKRHMVPIKSRRRCKCGCSTKVTHSGLANGMQLTSGCELWVRMWVKDAANAIRSFARNNTIEKRIERAKDISSDEAIKYLKSKIDTRGMSTNKALSIIKLLETKYDQ